MHVLGHDNEGMDLKSTFAAVAVHRLQEEFDAIFNDEQAASLPRQKRYEISSRRGEESSRFQERTSAAKAAIFA